MRSCENQSKNLSKKERQEALCALPLVGVGQDALAEDCTELARTGAGGKTHFLCRAWLLLAGSAVITRGDNGRQPDRDVQTGLSNRERRNPEIPCQSHQPQNAGCDISRESWNPLKQWELSIRTAVPPVFPGNRRHPQIFRTRL